MSECLKYLDGQYFVVDNGFGGENKDFVAGVQHGVLVRVREHIRRFVLHGSENHARENSSDEENSELFH